ncbi:MAG: DNA polymerase III subunit gamma/tau [Paracoccaceae bacterium]
MKEPSREGRDRPSGYQVLARKYRPQTFDDLIGQEAMVRTLRNAFAADRIAHAFILTGVRGVGKTTTARIIAKGLNCVGTDGKGAVTIEPCGECGPCRAISDGRHVDVLELDAATHTQVDKMRDILAGVAYRPTEVRYKIYIFDEVHMLSPSAFAALLKTLEEPPGHVKFIFATTEIRKVPVTILSRCQRFDLRRIEPEEMVAFLSGIAAKEGAGISPEALSLITRAAEGSARDALSLLDQAIAHGAGETTAEQVRAMLGLADRGRILDLFELIMRGRTSEALRELSAQYASGADPAAVLRDLAEVTHWVSVVKISPEAADDPTVAPDERARGRELAGGLPMRSLTRMWQMLLKALEEVAIAPNAMMAAEMAVIRLTHVAELPSPEDLVRALDGGGAARPGGPGGNVPGVPPGGGATAAAAPRGAAGKGKAGAANAGAAAPAMVADPQRALSRFAAFDDVVALIHARRDIGLLIEVENHLRLAKYSPGRIEFEPTPDAPADLAQRLAGRLRNWTGVRWVVSVVAGGGGETLAQQGLRNRSDLESRALEHPLTRAVLAEFPGARITEVRTPEPPRTETGDGEAEYTGDPSGDWDPFDPFDEEN